MGTVSDDGYFCLHLAEVSRRVHCETLREERELRDALTAALEGWTGLRMGLVSLDLILEWER